MKDPKNIEALNILTMYYVTLHGLQGIVLDPENPMAYYFTSALMGRLNIDNTNSVPNSILHDMLEEAYDFYKEIDNIDTLVNPMMKQQIEQQLGDIKFDEYVESSVKIYKDSLYYLVTNYNSKKEEYNQMKIDILDNQMNVFIENEDYMGAAEMRDKIKEIKEML